MRPESKPRQASSLLTDAQRDRKRVARSFTSHLLRLALESDLDPEITLGHTSSGAGSQIGKSTRSTSTRRVRQGPPAGTPVELLSCVVRIFYTFHTHTRSAGSIDRLDLMLAEQRVRATALDPHAQGSPNQHDHAESSTSASHSFAHRQSTGW